MSESFALFPLGLYKAELERANNLPANDDECRRVASALKELRDSEGNLEQTGNSFKDLLDQLADADRHVVPNDAKSPSELFVAIVDEYRQSARDDCDGGSSELFRFSEHLEAIREREECADKDQSGSTEDNFVIKEGGTLARCDDLVRIVANRNKLISEYGEMIAFGFRSLNDSAAYDQRVNLNGSDRLMSFLQRMIDAKSQGDDKTQGGGVRLSTESGVAPMRESDAHALVVVTNAEHERKTVVNQDPLPLKNEIDVEILVSDRPIESSRARDEHLDTKSSMKSSEEHLPHADDVLTEYKRAWSYEMGLGQVRRNLNEACRWYRLAVEHGDNAAQAALRNLCAYAGEGFDFKAVAKWCRDLADNDDSWAQELLGWMYEMGRGEVRNKSKAIEWYKRSARHGNENAKQALRRLRG